MFVACGWGADVVCSMVMRMMQMLLQMICAFKFFLYTSWSGWRLSVVLDHTSSKLPPQHTAGTCSDFCGVRVSAVSLLEVTRSDQKAIKKTHAA